MKYNVGDKVKISEDIHPGINGAVAANKEMIEMAGDIVTISTVRGDMTYYIKEDGEYWRWTDEMFESVCPKDLIKPGMVVKTRNGSKYVNINGMLMHQSGHGFLCGVEELRDDLTEEIYKDQEIIEIYETEGRTINELFVDEYLELVWKRPEPKELTLSEIEKELGYKVKIIGE